MILCLIASKKLGCRGFNKACDISFGSVSDPISPRHSFGLAVLGCWEIGDAPVVAHFTYHYDIVRPAKAGGQIPRRSDFPKGQAHRHVPAGHRAAEPVEDR